MPIREYVMDANEAETETSVVCEETGAARVKTVSR